MARKISHRRWAKQHLQGRQLLAKFGGEVFGLVFGLVLLGHAEQARNLTTQRALRDI